MNKFIVTSLFSLLMALSINANASATLHWDSTPTQNSAVRISSSGTGTSIDGQAFFIENQRSGFSHSWNFTIDPTSTIAVGIVNLYANQFLNAQVKLDGILLSGSSTDTFLGGISYWSFSEILTGGSHNLVFSADSVNTQNGLALYSMKLTASPIPAAVWLFGSAVIGIGGLASRRKTISAEV